MDGFVELVGAGLDVFGGGLAMDGQEVLDFAAGALFVFGRKEAVAVFFK